MDASHYLAEGTLRDGSVVTVRAQRPTDREGIRGALLQMGPESIQRRFFAPRRSFTQGEVSHFLDIDFVSQVALVAAVDDDLVGGGRYVVFEPGVAEVAFAVADAWQGCGLGRLLMEHLVGIARRQGLRQLVAEVLMENAAMLAVFRKCGLQTATRRDDGVVHVTM